MPVRRNFGKKKIAINTRAMTATTSQAITLNPFLKADPLSPTICSVERLVKRSEPAMIGKVKLRPPRKKPSALEFSSRRVIHQVSVAATAVKRIKEMTVSMMLRG